MSSTFSPKPFEIYLAKVRFHDCNDSRPVVVLDSLPPNILVVLCISAQMDKFTNHPDQMYLSRQDSDYAATLLPKDECFIDRTFHEIALPDLIKKFGVISGDLKRQLEKWM